MLVGNEKDLSDFVQHFIQYTATLSTKQHLLKQGKKLLTL